MSSRRDLRPNQVHAVPFSVVVAVSRHRRLVRAGLPLLDLTAAMRNWKKRVERES